MRTSTRQPSGRSPKPPGLSGPRAGARAASLTDAAKAVAAELRRVDAADYIAFIGCECFANIQDIVNSSFELIFRPGRSPMAGRRCSNSIGTPR